LGLVEREADPDDGRASRIRLTDAGVRAQRHVGLRHGRHVAQMMTRGLTDDQLLQLRDLCRALATTTESAPA
jgi:DNA-binding MarR family transcriptional regulator